MTKKFYLVKTSLINFFNYIFSILAMEKDNNELKKCQTTIKNSSINNYDSLKRNKTVQPGKFFNQEKLIYLTENPFKITRESTDNLIDMKKDDIDNEVILDNGGLIVKNQTIRKMSAILRTITENKKEVDPKNHHKLTITKIEEIDKSVIQSDLKVLNSEEIEKRISSHDLEILESLMYQYYQEISNNNIENYDNYVVNNLIIISFLEQILPKDIKPPKLSNEQIECIRNFDRSKKTLFLDLDETLIHSDTLGQFENHDAIINLMLDGNEIEFGLLIRPYCIEFLEFASTNFNVILFTAGHKLYAEAIINHLDPKKQFFHLKLFRDSCIEFRSFFIKDLSILPTFGPKDLVIVDNCIFSFAKNLSNGVLISTYYNDDNDCELNNLQGYLENNIIDCKDVRTINENVFKFDSTKSFLYDQLKSEGVLKK
jgi:Dullard-like phosphatase family protein